jgi:hypothetical protein
VGEFGVKKGSPAPHDVTRGIFAAGLSGGCGALPWLADAADFAAARERIRAARAFFEGVRWTQEKFAPTQPVFLSQPDQQENGVPALRAFAQVGQNEVHAFVYQVSDGPPQTLDPPRPVQLLIPGVAPGAYDLEFWSAVEGTILARQTVRAARQATKEAAEPAGIHVTLPWTGRDMAIKIIRAEPRP